MSTDYNWYLASKYGLYVTIAYEGHNVNPPTDRYVDGCGIYPDGSMPSSADELADAFDVQQFAKDCEEMGVEYVTFTAYHAHLYVLYPSKVVESKLPGHTSKRDVIRELIDALHSKGIKLQLYIHATVGDTMTDEERDALGWHDSTGNYKQWNDFFNEFFDEMGARYGTDIDSYYIDMIFDYPFLDMIDRQRLRQTLLAHNPNVVITGNGDATETTDYSSREDCRVYVEDAGQRFSYPVQTVVCLSKDWWTTVPDSGPNAARYSPEHLFKYLVLTAGTNTCGGGLAIGASPYVTRGFEPGIKETLVALGNIIKPISESIKNTYASSSYVTPAGATIPALPNGITATKSVCGRYEYIHVLVPPAGNTIHLPPPLDGKQFVSAVMLRTGHQAELRQDSQGVHITVPDEWDPLDTVIKLTVGHIPSKSFSTAVIPQEQIIAVSSDHVPGYEAIKAIDGDTSTIWLTNEDRFHSIVLNLGKVYEVAKLRVLPRQDGASASHLWTHIGIYSIFASIDGNSYVPVATGEWKRTLEEKSVSFPPVKAQYIKLVAGPDRNCQFMKGAVSAAEINVEAAVF